MKKIVALFALFSILVITGIGYAQKVKTVPMRPLTEVITTSVKPVSNSGTIELGFLTWGGDVATIYGEQKNIFKDEGLNVKLFDGNNFVTAAERAVKGETPYLRGTEGQVNLLAEIIPLEIFYQLTYSKGGDCVVVRDPNKIKSVKDFKGKKGVLQAYGPHLEYLNKLLADAGLTLNDVTLVFVPDITLPTYDTKGYATDPASAFRVDKSIDFAFVISPDANDLTSTKSEKASLSVKGSKKMLSTLTASKVIADVYGVRKDYNTTNPNEVQKLTHALLKSQEALAELVKSKNTKSLEYGQLMSKSAGLLFGDQSLVDYPDGLLLDCEFAGFPGNVQFFTGQGTTRTHKNISKEIQKGLVNFGLLSGEAPLGQVDFDYEQLKPGLKNTAGVTTVKPALTIDVKKVEQKIAQTTKNKTAYDIETTSWAEEGTLFITEIYFAPNQEDFSEDKYGKDFQKALEQIQTYDGAIFIVEGYADPLGVLKAKQNGESSQTLNLMIQNAKNLSYKRSQKVVADFLQFAKKRGYIVDESKFIPTGMGVNNPKYNPPKTKDEWNENRRVVFRLKNIEAELDEFTPLSEK